MARAVGEGMTDLQKEMRQSADFVTQAEIKVCLDCGRAYSVSLRVCPKCRRINHTRTLLIVATWKILPKHLQSDGHTGPCVRVTNIGGNAI